MHVPPADIIIPVWNRPAETRRCLASIIETAPDVRLIIVDTGSERETETILQEVTDALDERALLLSSTRNRGFVAALNQGLARSEAPWAVVVRQSAVVSPGWLDALLERAASQQEAGLIIPRFSRAGAGRVKDTAAVAREADHGSFYAMLIRRSLYDAIGGFDPDLDGGEWCLKEYSRRALEAGYLTCRAAASHVAVTEEPRFGSVERRTDLAVRSRERVTARTGEERNYCIQLPPSSSPEEAAALFRLFLTGARQGHRITVFVPGRLSRRLGRAGYGLLHDNVRLHGLPLVAAGRAARRAYERLKNDLPGVVPVVLAGETRFFGSDAPMQFPEFERSMAGAQVHGDEPAGRENG